MYECTTLTLCRACRTLGLIDSRMIILVLGWMHTVQYISYVKKLLSDYSYTYNEYKSNRD